MKIYNLKLTTNNLQNFKGKEKASPVFYSEKQTNETKKQLTTALIATAITSAFIGGMLTKRRLANIDNKTINSLKNTISELTKENNEIKKSSDQLKRILDEKLIPKETHNFFKKNLSENLKTVNNYDMTKPYSTVIKENTTSREHSYRISIPTKKEEKRIGIIRLAMQELSDAIRGGKNFSLEETSPKIYLFNNENIENRNYDFVAEAIIDRGQKKAEGFWLEKNYLNKTSFPDALETALHELSHKYGGDETAEFSYTLTDVNSRVLEKITNDSQTRLTMKILNEMWNEIA